MTLESQSHPEMRRAGPSTAEPAPALAFLCGADMNPLRIADGAGLEGARFVAIASMEGSGAGHAGLPAAIGSGEIWGIVLAIASPPDGAASVMVPVALDDGTTHRAQLITGPETAGSVEDILAEAHYWELPVAYRDRLAAMLFQ